MNKRKLYWWLQIGGWTFYVTLQVLSRVLSLTDESNIIAPQNLFLVSEGILFFITTHYVRYLIKKLEWIQLPIVVLIFRVIGISLLLGLILYWLRVIVSVPLGLYDHEELLLSNILGLSAVFSLIYFIWMVLYFAYHYFIEYNNALKHEAAIREIELNNLKSQLNPHFIFNALNSIRALVDENPIKSKKAITQLSNILRNSLTSDKNRLTTLNEELSVVQDYLGLERIRYEERLDVEIIIDPASGNLLVPPLMLQTLVENGIKHGISKLKKGGKLQLTTTVERGILIIEIMNSGKLLQGNDSNPIIGMGIENTKKRLKLIFGDEAQFSIKNIDENRVLTRLEIPKREIL